ncbi:MAG: hypothetical protein ACJATD_000235 [Alloalcanivorax sp.]|jgi:hypothetical protein
MYMTTKTYLILFLISVVVVSFYLILLWRVRRRREAVLLDNGFDKLLGPQARSIARSLKIEGAGAQSIRYGSKVYLLPGQEDDFVVCDLVVSVGFARYSGFSMVSVLGYLGKFEESSSFVIRKKNILETRFELREALPLANGWYVWCTGSHNDHLDMVADRVEAFGGSAILRKNGAFLSLYFRNTYLKEDEIQELIPEWCKFCKGFNEIYG